MTGLPEFQAGRFRIAQVKTAHRHLQPQGSALEKKKQTSPEYAVRGVSSFGSRSRFCESAILIPIPEPAFVGHSATLATCR